MVFYSNLPFVCSASADERLCVFETQEQEAMQK